MLTSVEVGLGGTWLMCPPQLLFVPDRDGDDRPDSAPEVILDGFTVPKDNYHNFANGLRWGPDGWLYGRCGASAPGLIGRPGTLDADRLPLTGGILRYDPRSRRVEVLNHGTTNPWGLDWDALGEAFFINTVNGHLWHSIVGAHFVRPHTIDPNPHVYQPIDQHADHFHWDIAKDWSDSRVVTAEHDRRGGGHAHSGLMIYGGGQWPAADAGKLFTLNFHGRRTNVERLDREGSGFVGRHEPDRFFVGDPRFRGIDLASGPDGGVYVLDWNDSGECHENTGVHRNSGRIFKITHGTPTRPTRADLTRLDPAALAKLHADPNHWYARLARRELIDRAARGEPITAATDQLTSMGKGVSDPRVRLEALWTRHALGQTTDAELAALLADDHEAIRTWAIRFLTEPYPLDTGTGRRPSGTDAPLPRQLAEAFDRLAREDHSGLVRLTLASTLQRLAMPDRANLAARLVRRAEDAEDHNLPLLVWYGLIPLAERDPIGLARLAAGCTWPTTRRLIARRLAEAIDEQPVAVVALLKPESGPTDAGYRADILGGIADGLRGRRQAPKPANWDELAPEFAAATNPAVRDRSRELGVLFGDGRALDEVKRLALDTSADLATRRAALRSLIADRPSDLRAICEPLLRTRFLNSTAARGMTLFDDPAAGQALVRSYPAFHPSERPALLDALVARPSFARALLAAVAAGSIPRGDISAFQARQVRSLGDAELARQLAEVWGELRDPAADKRPAIARIKAEQSSAALQAADPRRGRVLFNKLCASCHMMYGEGGAIGPDLTGSGRSNLDYLLENIVDPSATVTADFRVAVVAMRDGRTLNGLVRAPTERTITLQGQNQTVVLDRAEVERIEPSALSLMPEGLLDSLKADEVRDLFGYLMRPTQVPLP